MDHEPVVVRPLNGVYRIVEGRKRFVSALSAGRPDMWAIIWEQDV